MESASEFDEVNCDIENLTIIGETASAVIQDVVIRLPQNVAEWVVDNITFIDLTGCSGLACHVQTIFPSQHRIKHDVGDVRLLVILNPEQDETEQRAEFRTAHEIAHHWCGHCVGSARTPEEYEQLEQEADSQANKWGFPGKSTRMAR